jgi:hypothetical protein
MVTVVAHVIAAIRKFAAVAIREVTIADDVLAQAGWKSGGRRVGRTGAADGVAHFDSGGM